MTIAIISKVGAETEVVPLKDGKSIIMVSIYDNDGELVDQLFSKRNFDGKVRREVKE